MNKKLNFCEWKMGVLKVMIGCDFAIFQPVDSPHTVTYDLI